MDILKNYKTHNPGSGKLLVAEPFLADPNFKRSVILLTEHKKEGSVGFVLNRKMDIGLSNIMDIDPSIDIPLYIGGPVQRETLHVIHMNEEVADSGYEIISGVFWGADFEKLQEIIEHYQVDNNKYKFFLGYSGWGEGQLDAELEGKSWIVTPSNKNIIFSRDEEELWKHVLKEMGGNFSYLANSPDNPQLN